MWSIINNLTGWEIFTYSYISLSILANLIFSVIILIGGSYDLLYLFKTLKKGNQKNAKS